MSEGKRGWKGRRAYLDDFQKTASGEYVYTGVLHHYEGKGMSRGKALAVLWALSAVMAVTAVVPGCVTAVGMQNTIYVLLPYMGSLMSTVSVIWAMCRLAAGGDPLRDYVYRATVGQARLRSLLTAGFTAAALVGSLVCMILHGVGDMLPGTIVFWVCELLLLGCALLWLRVMNQLRWS